MMLLNLINTVNKLSEYESKFSRIWYSKAATSFTQFVTGEDPVEAWIVDCSLVRIYFFLCSRIWWPRRIIHFSIHYRQLCLRTNWIALGIRSTGAMWQFNDHVSFFPPLSTNIRWVTVWHKMAFQPLVTLIDRLTWGCRRQDTPCQSIAHFHIFNRRTEDLSPTNLIGGTEKMEGRGWN